jgi:hypothetical protein
MADIALFCLLVHNGIHFFKVVGKGNLPRFVVYSDSFYPFFLANGRNNIGKIFPVILQHAVSSGAFDQVTGLNRAIDHAVIKMLGIRGNIKVHDASEGDHEQDDQKEIKLKA